MVADIVILGGGFGGCLTALIARKIGLRVVVIDRGAHPRVLDHRVERLRRLRPADELTIIPR